MERAKGFEPSTPTLAKLPELPHPILPPATLIDIFQKTRNPMRRRYFNLR